MKTGSGAFQGSCLWLASEPSLRGFMPNSRATEHAHGTDENACAHRSIFACLQVFAVYSLSLALLIFGCDSELVGAEANRLCLQWFEDCFLLTRHDWVER